MEGSAEFDVNFDEFESPARPQGLARASEVKTKADSEATGGSDGKKRRKKKKKKRKKGKRHQDVGDRQGEGATTAGGAAGQRSLRSVAMGLGLGALPPGLQPGATGRSSFPQPPKEAYAVSTRALATQSLIAGHCLPFDREAYLASLESRLHAVCPKLRGPTGLAPSEPRRGPRPLRRGEAVETATGLARDWEPQFDMPEGGIFSISDSAQEEQEMLQGLIGVSGPTSSRHGGALAPGDGIITPYGPGEVLESTPSATGGSSAMLRVRLSFGTAYIPSDRALSMAHRGGGRATRPGRRSWEDKPEIAVENSSDDDSDDAKSDDDPNDPFARIGPDDPFAPHPSAATASLDASAGAYGVLGGPSTSPGPAPPNWVDLDEKKQDSSGVAVVGDEKKSPENVRRDDVFGYISEDNGEDAD